MDIHGKGMEPEQQSSKMSIVMFVLLFAAVLCITAFVYIKSQNIDLSQLSISDWLNNTPQSVSQNSSLKAMNRFQFDQKENPVFSVYKGYIIKCTKDSVKWLNQKGELLQAKPVSIANPVMKISEGNLLIADINGNNFYFINGKEIKWSEIADGTIINADIGDKGYVSIVRTKKGYKDAIDVYDSSGNWIFTTVRSESYILSSKVLDSDEQVLLNSVDTSGINANSILESINMRGNLTKNVTVENTIFPLIRNIDGDSIFAASDNMLICFDKDIKELWRKEFSRVYSSNVSQDEYAVVAAKGDGKTGISGNTVVVSIIDSDGDDVAQYPLNDKVIGIDSYSNIIALNTGREIHFINTKGKLIGKYASKSDIVDVQFFSKQEAAIITRNEVADVKLN